MCGEATLSTDDMASSSSSSSSSHNVNPRDNVSLRTRIWQCHVFESMIFIDLGLIFPLYLIRLAFYIYRYKFIMNHDIYACQWILYHSIEWPTVRDRRLQGNARMLAHRRIRFLSPQSNKDLMDRFFSHAGFIGFSEYYLYSFDILNYLLSIYDENVNTFEYVFERGGSDYSHIIAIVQSYVEMNLFDNPLDLKNKDFWVLREKRIGRGRPGAGYRRRR